MNRRNIENILYILIKMEMKNVLNGLLVMKNLEIVMHLQRKK